MATLSNAVINVFVAPRSLFDDLKEAKGWGWIALLFSVVFYALVAYWMYSGMSNEWIVEQQVAQMGDVSPAEAEQARGFMQESASYTAPLAAVSIVLVTLIINAIYAGYFKLVGRTDEYSYGDWYSFSLWTMMPMFVNALGLALLLLLADSPDVPLNLSNYASLNQLLLNLPLDHNLYAWAEAFNLFSLWSIVIAALGLQSWAKMKPITSYVFAALPFCLIMGIWLLVALI
ncbi:hypothetical protein GCM10009092_12800 [Bowmanella denitrificans]|uniref:Yip1 domain-containing protein n=1 Tax=Bowmanella denitrificans TaxID=366582 RepID=A0ABP3GMZ3_9ALTE